MSARDYVVGLPVIVTVHDDDRVTFEVDTSEASREVSRYEHADYTDAQLEADAELVGKAHERRLEAARLHVAEFRWYTYPTPAGVRGSWRCSCGDSGTSVNPEAAAVAHKLEQTEVLR